MNNVALVLGDVTFRDFEVPQAIHFGGRQNVAVHELIGGGKVVDALGGQPAEIEFCGIFSGVDAGARARVLDGARLAGAVLPLGWGGFYYQVIIAELMIDYEKPSWMPFEIRCEVITDISVAALLPAVAGLISNDLAYATNFAANAGVDAAVLGSSGNAAMLQAQAAVAGSVASSGAGLLNYAASFGMIADAGGNVLGLGQMVAAAGTLAAATSMQGYVNRAAANSGKALA